DDICVRIEAFNRGPDAAPLHLIPHLWFRNTWGWGAPRLTPPTIALDQARGAGRGVVALVADDRRSDRLTNLTFQYQLGERRLYRPPEGRPYFTDNETNCTRCYGPHAPNASPYTKDAFHRLIVDGDMSAVNPAQTGTKACLHYIATIPAGASQVWRF